MSTRRAVGPALAFFRSMPQHLTDQQNAIAERILKEIVERLGFLNNVGLDYLNLDRTSGTLSGGESQRIRLASQIGSGLSGVLYVLDEPSIGLHQKDNERLLVTLRRLRDLGNTVIVVEHDEDAIRSADYVIDMGPGAGMHGGEVIVAGSLDEVLACERSLTADYLTGRREVAVPARRRKGSGKKLTVRGARANNLKDVTAAIPLGTFTCVTGVSGSGKSTFTIDTLFASASRQLNGARILAGHHEKIEGLQHLDKVIDIDQFADRPHPALEPGHLYGRLHPDPRLVRRAARERGARLQARPLQLQRQGRPLRGVHRRWLLKIEMHFLPDVYVTCDVCHGRRYNRETLEVVFKGQSIADVLDMTVEDAAEFFKAVPGIRDKMLMLVEVGLGYVKVGQQATTLSGGEAQRVKLAKELSRRATGNTLYILDEPTTGLHFEDVRKLLEVLHALVEQGNSVVVIEHNLEVIKTADWVIDLGPRAATRAARSSRPGRPKTWRRSRGAIRGVFEGAAGHAGSPCAGRRTFLIGERCGGVSGPPAIWREAFLDALRLLAVISQNLAERGRPRPILVGGGAVEYYSASAIMTGDIDLCSPIQPELEAEMRRHGFVKPSGPGKLTRGWIHPDLGLGFEIVSSHRSTAASMPSTSSSSRIWPKA